MSYLSANQVAQYAYDAGFRHQALVTAIAVSDGESGFNPKAASPSDTSLGLWQIGKVHDSANPSALFDPTYNAKMAYTISDHGTNWSPWRVYTSGTYKKFLGIAKKAAHRIKVKSSVYHSLRVDVNSHSFVAIKVNHETYLLWTALKKWDMPYKYTGKGKFTIDGQHVQGVVYQHDTYLPWNKIPDIQATKINGIFNFTSTYTPTPKFPEIKVKVDNQTFPAIIYRKSTYLQWTVLKKWNIKYKYLGKGDFSIDGHLVQGVVDKGNTYLYWASIPGIKAVKIHGESNFTHSH